MTPGRPVSVTLRVRDVEASVDFYRRALGLRWVPEIWSFQFGEYPRDDFFLISIDEPSKDDLRPVGGGQFGFVVDHLAAAHRRALDAGAREWYPPQDNPVAPPSSGIEDADGNRVALIQA